MYRAVSLAKLEKNRHFQRPSHFVLALILASSILLTADLDCLAQIKQQMVPLSESYGQTKTSIATHLESDESPVDFRVVNMLISIGMKATEPIEISFKGCREFAVGALEELAKKLPIQSLQFSNCELSGQDIKAICSNPSLRKLTVSDNLNVTDETLKGLTSGKELLELDFRNTSVQGQFLEFLQKPEHLQKLDISRTSLSRKYMPFLRNLSGLEEFNVYNVKFNPKELLNWCPFGKLVSFGCDLKEDTDAWLPVLAKAGLFSRLEKRSLDLSESSLSNAGLRALQNASGIHWLNISKTKITDKGLSELVRLPILATLILDDDAITDKGLGSLVQHEKLSKLTAQFCLLKGEGFQSLCRLPVLEQVIINGNRRRLSQKGLDSIARLPHLKYLSITGCKLPSSPQALSCFEQSPIEELHLSGPTVQTIASLRKIPNLISLSMGGTIFDNEKATELGKLVRIAKLSLHSSRNMNSFTVRELGKLKKLEQLDLRQSDISSAELAVLRSELKDCQIFEPNEEGLH